MGHYQEDGDNQADCHNAITHLMLRALKGPLLPAQQQQVLVALEQAPRLAISLLPGGSSQLPSLVEHCPVIASALLQRLFQRRTELPYSSSSGQADHLCDNMLLVLAQSDVSLHGMEVVNRLVSTVDLPGDFVRSYIVNCIRSCESAQDKYVQSRLVRWDNH